ncbi:MAG: SLC13 family permease [Anaerolineae bacterium]
MAMTPEMWITLGILITAIVLFITEWLRVDVVALGVVVGLMLTGLLTPEEALAGFSSTVVMAIASLFVVGGAVLQTGLARVMGNQILKVAGTSEPRLIAVIMIATALMSSFMSDTGVVAVMLPAIISLAASARISPSRLLIPLAFGSLLGGATTLIGTPPNIIVADLLRSEGLRPFTFFSFTPMGLALLAGGVVFMVLVGRALLPDHRPRRDIQQVETPEELLELYRLPDNLFRLRVRRRSPLVGQTIPEAGIGTRFGISVLEIARPAAPQTVARLGEQRLVVQSDTPIRITAIQDTELQADDVLIVQGEANQVSSAAAFWDLAIQPASSSDHAALVSDEVGIAEVVLPPRSSLIGKTLVDLRFGSTYKLTVLDIRRPGVEGRLSLKETPLSFGDTLLVQGEWHNITALKKQRRDFVVIGDAEAWGGPPNRQKAPIALLILMGMLALLISGVVPLAVASMLAALLMVLTGCLSIDEAYDAINWKSLVLVAGMLPMATALEKVGLVSLAATGFTSTLGTLGPHVVMAGLFLLTSLFTQVLSNTATTVLIAPVALAIATRLGVQPHALLMAVAIAASMAFATPVASPVNTLVMSAGNYRFSDYAKVGVPLIVLMLIAALLILPLLWPF